jgi:hypothetical protein
MSTQIRDEWSNIYGSSGKDKVKTLAQLDAELDKSTILLINVSSMLWNFLNYRLQVLP